MKITHEYKFSYLDQVCRDMLLRITTSLLHAKMCWYNISNPVIRAKYSSVNQVQSLYFDPAKFVPDQNMLFCMYVIFDNVGDELMCKDGLFT